MKLFNFKKKSNPKLPVNKKIQRQIQQNYEWLLTTYGYPEKLETFVFSEHYFPISFSSNRPNYKAFVADLCTLLQLDNSLIAINLHTDLSTSRWTPYFTEAMPAFAEFNTPEKQIKIHLLEGVLSNNKRTLRVLIQVLLKIKLFLHHEDYASWEDVEELSLIFGIYLGFGALLAENTTDFGTEHTLNWTKSWDYRGPFTVHEISYIIALHFHAAKVAVQEQLPYFFNVIRPHILTAESEIAKAPPSFIHLTKAKASSLFFTAHLYFKQHDYNKAIDTLEQALPYCTDVYLKANIYNNLGYNLSRLSKYKKAIVQLNNALSTDKNHPFAHDNLGYCYIKIGALDLAKQHLDKALKNPRNNIAYSYRNLALYHDALSELEKAKHYFNKAFSYADEPVDLLAYYYGMHLIKTGNSSEAMQYIERSKEKGEPEGITKFNELNRK